MSDLSTATSGGPERAGSLTRLLAPVPPGRAAARAAAVVAGLLLVAWSGLVIYWHDRAHHERQSVASQTALRLDDWVTSRMLVLESIRKMRSQGLIVDPVDWRTWVGLDLETIDGFQAVNWIDTDGVIQVTAPPDGNEGALGKRLDEHPSAGPVFARAKATGLPQASPPLDLFQGGRAFTTYLPVRPLDGSPPGFVNGVFRVDRIVALALDHLDLERHEVVLRDGDDLLWASDDGRLDPGTLGRAELSVAQRTWTVEVAAARPVVPLGRHLAALAFVLAAAAAAGAGAAWMARQADQTSKAQADTQRIAQRLVEVERMESLGRMAGGIAHDFNNVLTVVIGRTSELEERLRGAPPDVHESLQAILDASDRAARLVEALLTFARRGEDVEGQVDAAAHLHQLGPMLKHLAGRRVELTVEVGEGATAIPLSPAAFDRLVLNLVGNAVEAVARRGRIRVALETSAEETCLVVQDDGPGMSPAVRARIFEPFFTTKETGTGLGLATSYGLVTQAGGRLLVDTSPGQGTTFRACFPIAPDQSRQTS